MTAAIVTEPAGTWSGPDAVTSWLTETLDRLGRLALDPEPAGDADRIDRIGLLEQVKGAVEAVQAVESVRFARSQVAAQQRLDVDPRRVGRGIADQLALACRVSPSEGSRRLRMARDLVLDMPRTLAALAGGEIGPWTARLVTGELSHLPSATRRQIDTQLAGSRLAGSRLAEWSPRQCAASARRLAYAADPEAAVERSRRARGDRCVTLRPAPDTMSLLTGLLPVEQGVACLAALRAEVATRTAAGDPRGRGQIMADTLVERITGQTAAPDLPLEVQIVVSAQTLLDPADPTPAEIPGHGPLPADLARDLLRGRRDLIFWRRLVTDTGDTTDDDDGEGRRIVVGIDRRRRRFTGPLADLIDARDGQQCRDPSCAAPIRHHDHIRRYIDGGPTTVDNGRGVCERGNLVREMPGWTVRLTDLDDHSVETTTPTGHRYLSRPPEPP